VEAMDQLQQQLGVVAFFFPQLVQLTNQRAACDQVAGLKSTNI